MQNKRAMIDFVIRLLKNNIPVFYYYHNYEHALHVMEKALEIGRYEKCTEQELGILGTAGLWHDTGYIRTYAGHEEESCRLVRQYLPEYGYSDADIGTICGMVMATKIPQAPKTKLEEILADADLEYLGTEAFPIKANALFRELQSVNPAFTEAEWNQTQIRFLQSHHYFTRFCKDTRESIKTQHVYKLRKRLQ
jgi:uncharacterized protein